MMMTRRGYFCGEKKIFVRHGVIAVEKLGDGRGGE
jgi:hypothetical protein